MLHLALADYKFGYVSCRWSMPGVIMTSLSMEQLVTKLVTNEEKIYPMTLLIPCMNMRTNVELNRVVAYLGRRHKDELMMLNTSVEDSCRHRASG